MWFQLGLLVAFFLLQCALASFSQETLSCGHSTYQVNFEPGRPMPSSGVPLKYQYRPLETLIELKTPICNVLDNDLDYEPIIATSLNIPEARLIITYCENCNKCVEKLPAVTKFFTKFANTASIQSLLVIVHGSWDRISIDNNTPVRFVQMGEKPGLDATSVCELIDTVDSDALRSFSKTSVLFVSISFIILMVISLAWLVFYYVQRFRYAHAKDRLQRRLFNAAKKALTRIPTRPVKPGDGELELECAICIDPYRIGDIVRMLPCRHNFHKGCIDPWLLEHRTCPMCKSDILKAFGYHVNVTSRRRAQFSAPGDDQHVVVTAEGDHLSVDANSTASESNAYPFPVVSELHDPFSFSPSTSPQLVQVMHTTNARGFIIPLTVHNPNSAPVVINGAVERHHPITLSTVSTNSANRGENGSLAGPSTSGARLLRSAAYSSGQRKNRSHVVNLVHVRSRSLSCAAPSLPNQTQVQIEHHEDNEHPTALFRTSTVDEKEVEVHRVPSPAPDPNSLPVRTETTKIQNFVGNLKKENETSTSKLSRPSTVASYLNNKHVPLPARQFSTVPYSTPNVNNPHHTSNSTPLNDAISVESL